MKPPPGMEPEGDEESPPLPPAVASPPPSAPTTEVQAEPDDDDDDTAPKLDNALSKTMLDVIEDATKESTASSSNAGVGGSTEAEAQNDPVTADSTSGLVYVDGLSSKTDLQKSQEALVAALSSHSSSEENSSASAADAMASAISSLVKQQAVLSSALAVTQQAVSASLDEDPNDDYDEFEEPM